MHVIVRKPVFVSLTGDDYVYAYVHIKSDVAFLNSICTYLYIPRVIQRSYYKGNGATDNIVYAYITCNR